MPKHYETIFGWFDFSDIYREVVDKYNDAIFIEIGSFQGKSACYMAEYIKERGKNIKLICIDLFPSKEELQTLAGSGVGQGAEFKEILKLPKSLQETFTDNLTNAGVIEYVTPIKSNSHEASYAFANGEASFIFVDAGHHYDAVYKDLELWWEKVAVGGIMAGHDYYEEVYKAVHDFFDPRGIKVERRGSSFFVKKD